MRTVFEPVRYAPAIAWRGEYVLTARPLPIGVDHVAGSGMCRMLIAQDWPWFDRAWYRGLLSTREQRTGFNVDTLLQCGPLGHMFEVT